MHYTASRGQEEGEKERKELERAKMMQEGTLRELQAQLEALQNIQDAYDTATEQLNFVQVRERHSTANVQTTACANACASVQWHT